MVDDCDVSAIALTGTVTVLGCSFSFGLPDVSTTLKFIENLNNDTCMVIKRKKLKNSNLNNEI